MNIVSEKEMFVWLDVQFKWRTKHFLKKETYYIFFPLSILWTFRADEWSKYHLYEENVDSMFGTQLA